jgi:hypothetical protein
VTPLPTFLRDRPTRGLIWLSLNEVGRFLVYSSVSDGGGGQTDTYTPEPDAEWSTTTNVPCRIDPLSGNQAEAAGRISDRSTATVTLPPGTDVSVDDDFQIKGVGRFEITAVRVQTDEFARVIEVTDRTES